MMNKRAATLILKEMADFIPSERKEEYKEAISSLLKPQWIDVDKSLPYEFPNLVHEDDEGRQITDKVAIITSYEVIDMDYMVQGNDGEWPWDYYGSVEGWMELPN